MGGHAAAPCLSDKCITHFKYTTSLFRLTSCCAEPHCAGARPVLQQPPLADQRLRAHHSLQEPATQGARPAELPRKEKERERGGWQVRLALVCWRRDGRRARPVAVGWPCPPAAKLGLKLAVAARAGVHPAGCGWGCYESPGWLASCYINTRRDLSLAPVARRPSPQVNEARPATLTATSRQVANVLEQPGLVTCGGRAFINFVDAVGCPAGFVSANLCGSCH